MMREQGFGFFGSVNHAQTLRQWAISYSRSIHFLATMMSIIKRPVAADHRLASRAARAEPFLLTGALQLVREGKHAEHVIEALGGGLLQACPHQAKINPPVL
jgi:hypothetical protein